MSVAIPWRESVVGRAEMAMRRAFHHFEQAELHQQPPHVLDRFEARYFETLRAFETAMRGDRGVISAHAAVASPALW